MASKQMLYDVDARTAMFAGVQKLAAAVKVTLGPTGRNVLLQKSFGSPKVTKDGVTVSKEIELPNPFENMGAKMANQAASKTSDIAGDGTTTAVVLAEAIVQEGLKNVTAGANPMALKRGIDQAVEAAIAAISDQARPCKSTADLRKVATVSANWNRDIGDLIAEAFDKVGVDGVITVEEGKSIVNELEVVEGMQFDKGYISAYFMTNPNTLECVMEDPFILLHEKKISNLRELVPLLEKIASSGKSLLILAEDVEGEALAALVVNRLRGVLNVAAVKAPAFGDRRKAIMGDLAVLTAGELISEDLGLKLENVEIGQLGRAKRVIITKDDCTIIEGAGSNKDIKARAETIRTQIEKTTSDYDREKLQERLAKLTGGVALIKAGAATEAEMKERKDLIDDAVHATRAAAQEGIVPGGGVVFLHCIDAVRKIRDKARGDEKIGVDIVLRALSSPTRQIVANAGEDGDVVVAEILEKGKNVGYNAATGEYVDMVQAGIIDPAKVSRTALQNGASVAGLLLTTDLMVTEYKEDKDEAPIAGAVI
ncbi:MAG: 60 kDa chaperonin 1 [Planctomycetes bacterium ADurb.Bin126]|nr:MAG: 60 kDa chaperonin 1 [Planctomycetes bacterium ADurb.Bin126]HOD83498.1 chaperonin GroEL [Phycisphaerae bacterium]HQL75265.1 chaperonin GroEL [Phycisphaerae bacterium]